MKHTITVFGAMGIIMILSGCQQAPTNWSRDCQKHFSVTGRELSQCQQKIEEGALQDIPAGQVSIDPENAIRESFDDLGKGGAIDEN